MFRKTCLALLHLLFLIPVANVAAQNTGVRQKIGQAVELMDAGSYTESEELLRSVLAAEPDNYIALYELCFLFYQKKDYAEAVKLISEAVRMPDVEDSAYQLLGNSYDLMGDPKKAIATYKKGLKKFPDSGKLNLELGNMAYNAKEYDSAIGYYEQGIAVEPSFPSNYFNISGVFLTSSEPIWGILYGEIFMNLEHNTDRSRSMSKALYDTYRTAVVIGERDGKRAVKYNFTKNNTISLGKNRLSVPFPIIYSLTVEKALPKDADEMDLPTLVTMRCNFIERFYDKPENGGRAQKYSNVLFDYQHQIAQAGHLEAYNHWLFREGDPETFAKWVEAHAQQWDAFVEWYNENLLEVAPDRYFHRSQYNDVALKF